MRTIYRKKHLDFLRDGYATMLVPELATAFNTMFKLDKTAAQIKSTLSSHGITCGRKHGARLMPCRLYTPDQALFLRENYASRSVAELTDLFNGQYGTAITKQQIRTFVHNRGITSGRTGQFEKGQKSWNLGKKGYMGANLTSFKKGDAPANRKPLGTERIDSKDGFILVKVAETNLHTGAPTRFKHKHVHVWEQANGKVPKGMVVSFMDGKKENCDLANLMLLTRAELLVANLHGYRDQPDELKPSVLALAKLEAKAGVRTRPGRGRPPVMPQSPSHAKEP